MGRCGACIQSRRRGHLRVQGFVRLGATARAGIAFGDRRAVHLGISRFSNLCCLLRAKSDLGRFYPRSEAMANRLLWLLTIPIWLVAVAIDFAHH